MAALAPGEDGEDETVKAPGSLVLSAYVTCPDVTAVVTPDLELAEAGRILFVDLAAGSVRIGGSAIAQAFGQLGDVAPDLTDPARLRRAFEVTQRLIREDQVRAGHDRSDGGLVTTLLEMAFAGNCGIEVDLLGDAGQSIPILFNEELGLVLEVPADRAERAVAMFRAANVTCCDIGHATSGHGVRISIAGEPVLEADMRDLRDVWESTSFELDGLQADRTFVDQERKGLRQRVGPTYRVPWTVEPTRPEILVRAAKPKVAVVREEGSNSDREMASAFFLSGFEPWDVTMSDLLARRTGLESFQGIAFVGGFSYADVLDSAKGWAGVIRFHPELAEQFDHFATRPDTFTLGVCNGCQLEALLGWVPWRGIEHSVQPRFIRNASDRFECRYSAVRILESPSVLLRGMEGATIGVWLAHGEGRAFFPDAEILDRVEARRLAPIRFVDDAGDVTERYPFNPNGSAHGIAALCSPDGRHLAIMPHPERGFLSWQCGWNPPEWREQIREAADRGQPFPSPWLRMFQNAREWCDGS